jgi:uncharacterized protein YndB with AHSA1/START domain
MKSSTVAHHHGRYLEIVPNVRIVMSRTSPALENTEISVDLEDVEGGSRITLSIMAFPRNGSSLTRRVGGSSGNASRRP